MRPNQYGYRYVIRDARGRFRPANTTKAGSYETPYEAACVYAQRHNQRIPPHNDPEHRCIHGGLGPNQCPGIFANGPLAIRLCQKHWDASLQQYHDLETQIDIAQGGHRGAPRLAASAARSFRDCVHGWRGSVATVGSGCRGVGHPRPGRGLESLTVSVAHTHTPMNDHSQNRLASVSLPRRIPEDNAERAVIRLAAGGSSCSVRGRVAVHWRSDGAMRATVDSC